MPYLLTLRTDPVKMDSDKIPTHVGLLSYMSGYFYEQTKVDKDRDIWDWNNLEWIHKSILEQWWIIKDVLPKEMLL